MADTGARPKEKVSKHTASIQDQLVGLENEEVRLKSDLQKLTPKKPSPDVNLRDELLRERARLQQLVEDRRQSAETRRLRKEIEELRRQLDDVDIADSSKSAFPEFGPRGPDTIHDLRASDVLNRKADIKMPTEISDSLEGIHHSQSSQKIKSGKVNKCADIQVKKTQLWPHSFVPSQLCKQSEIEYNDLSMTQFVAGYCAIISHLFTTGTRDSLAEIKRRVVHLKSLMCFAHVYQWTCILNIHQEVLIDIERGNRSWNDSFSDIESLNLLLDRSSTSASLRTTAGSSSTSNVTPGKRTWFCSKFQKGECSKTSPHSARIGSEIRTVKHVCATCFLKDRELRDHPESSASCPHKQA